MNLFSKKRKLNDKGNTLSVVLIGIFILAVLGTLILNVTATNLRVRATEYKAEKQFYYAEKAIDQIYAGIGAEVTNSFRTSYNEVLTNYVKTAGSSSYTTLSNSEANTKFNAKYIELLKDNTNGYPAGTSGISNIKNRFEGYINDIHDCTCSIDMNNADVEYDDNLNTTKITIKNVKVITTKNGYSSSIKTDFIITTPTVNINFIDSSSKDFTYLFNNALVINGNNTVSTPALSITSGKSLNVNGNCYFGSNSTGANKAYAKDSIKLNNLSKLNMSSVDNIVCKGSIVLDGGDANITTGKLWARNLVTQGNNDNLTISGNCIIPDDLEVNGYKSTIKISNGSYYGCGYEGSSTDYKKEANSGDTVKYISDSNGTDFTGTYIFNHEKRSAIIINGKSASVDLSNLNQLVLGGRSYIDLDNIGNEAFATYMTGESVSLIGNQKLYLSDKTKLGDIAANPCDYNQIKKYIDEQNQTLDYTNSKIDSSVLAKKVGNDVFFYDKIIDPSVQTDNFINKCKDAAYQKIITDSVKSLDVKQLLLPENRFTVGTVSEVKEGYNYNMLGAGESGSNGFTADTFYSLMPDLELRTKFMTNQLKDFSNYEIGTQFIPQTQIPKETTPYKEFINSTNLVANYTTNNCEIQNLQDPTANPSLNISPAVTQGLKDILAQEGLTGTNTGFYFYNNPGQDKQIANGIHAGVIITTGDCNISNDFTGLIICGGNLRVDGNCTITSNLNIVQYLANNYPTLQEMLSGFVPGGSIGGNVDINDVSYKDFVFTDNWQKNVE